MVISFVHNIKIICASKKWNKKGLSYYDISQTSPQDRKKTLQNIKKTHTIINDRVGEKLNKSSQYYYYCCCYYYYYYYCCCCWFCCKWAEEEEEVAEEEEEVDVEEEEEIQHAPERQRWVSPALRQKVCHHWWQWPSWYGGAGQNTRRAPSAGCGGGSA